MLPKTKKINGVVILDDEYEWDREFGQSKERFPVLFHGTRSLYLDSILNNGVYTGHTGIDPEDLKEAVENTGMIIDGITFGDRHNVALTLAYDVAENFAIKKGPEQAKRFFRALDMCPDKLKHLITKYSEFRKRLRESEPVVLFIRRDLSDTTTPQYDGAKFLLNGHYHNQFLRNFKNISKAYADLVDEYGLNDAVQWHFRANNYCIDVPNVNKKNILGWVKID